MSSKILQMTISAQSKPVHTASIIFMHGSGGTGPMSKEGIKITLGKRLTFPHIRILYPTSPLRPYTPSNGYLQHVWFNRHSISLEAPEDLTTIEPMAEEINNLIDQEIQQGIDVKRIILGGFSMGSSLAMQMGYRFRKDIGGVFVLSSFLNQHSKVYEALESSPDDSRPPLFMCHGEKDDVVPYVWGEHTFKELQRRGVPGEFKSFLNLYHAVNKEELIMLQEWILQQLPPLQN
ncbi:lysophospholipase-like protein 1 [Homarus americanus]|uniref:Lysophospholipase-like protein 1-like n=1 Tax=Homarus americanus TaxID=6706 RepID=A0A8J5JTQ0_HOMAM|nr:lysophospholipase-like protein 1 [Homarus americanus]KAG7164132.1 Lysophospholipase-like protein 1-like [Homarus americanus]